MKGLSRRKSWPSFLWSARWARIVLCVGVFVPTCSVVLEKVSVPKPLAASPSLAELPHMFFVIGKQKGDNSYYPIAIYDYSYDLQESHAFRTDRAKIEEELRTVYPELRVVWEMED